VFWVSILKRGRGREQDTIVMTLVYVYICRFLFHVGIFDSERKKDHFLAAESVRERDDWLDAVLQVHTHTQTHARA